MSKICCFDTRINLISHDINTQLPAKCYNEGIGRSCGRFIRARRGAERSVPAWFWNSNVRSTAIVLNRWSRPDAADAQIAADGPLDDDGAEERPLGQHAGERAARWRRSSRYYRTVRERGARLHRRRHARRRRARARRSSRAARPTRAATDVPMATLLARRRAGHDAAADVRARRAPARSSTRRGCATPPIALFQQGLDSGFRIERRYAPYVGEAAQAGRRRRSRRAIWSASR